MYYYNYNYCHNPRWYIYDECESISRRNLCGDNCRTSFRPRHNEIHIVGWKCDDCRTHCFHVARELLFHPRITLLGYLHVEINNSHYQPSTNIAFIAVDVVVYELAPRVDGAEGEIYPPSRSPFPVCTTTQQ